MFKLIFLFFTILALNAQPLQLSNKQITFSVSPAGTLGTGLNQYGKGLIYQRHDYLNKVGVPFEFFSLKVNQDVYANDNAEGYKKRWPAPGLRHNNKNVPTTLERSDKSIIATTTQEGLFRIQHTYSIGDTSNTCELMSAQSQQKNINVQVEITNLSNEAKTFIYTRGIDMDPPDVKTINTMGYRSGSANIPPENLIYTISAKHHGRYPLSLYSKDPIRHMGAILEFDNTNGCLYDPQRILSKSKNALNGDGVIYMIFELGRVSPGESKNLTFSYYLNDKLEQLISDITNQDVKVEPAEGISFPVERINSIEYKKMDTKNISIHSKAPGINKRRFTIINDTNKLPKGIRLAVNGKVIGKSQKQFKYNKDIPITILRNKDYDVSNTEELTLYTEDTKCGKRSSFKVVIKPKKRNITLTMEGLPTTRLDELNKAKPIAVKVMRDNKQITGESFKDFAIESDCKGVRCHISKDEVNNQFLLYVKPKKILAFTAVGDVPIKAIVTEGTFEDDHAEQTTMVNIEDIGWKKWIEPGLWLLLLLLLLWYLYGITFGKKRFKKNQVVTYEELKRGKRDPNSERDYYLRKEVSPLDMFIPYKAQEVRIQDMIFRAERNRRVYLSKKSQEYVKYNRRDIDEAGKMHLRLGGGDTLQTDYAIYTIK